MNRLKHKLKSQNGASMLIALLFFLLCSMIGSSILMASVSNAGKSNSNEEQHQIYLALSSAVKLVCDDIENATYTGNYTYTETPVWGENENKEPVILYTQRDFTQNTGEFTGNLSSILISDLDAILSKKLAVDLAYIEEITDGYQGQLNLKPTTISKHTLTIQPDTDTYLDDMNINVELEIKETYAIYLTATYEGETPADNYTVYAELTPTQSAITVTSPNQGNNIKTNSMDWKLGWITTEDEEATT